MNTFLSLCLWTLLLVVCWPLALLVLLAWPIVWLLSIPFRILGGLVHGIVALASALFMLPARIFGAKA